jgi:hypothetical protein
MEVHHHSHTPRKKWHHYFWEFLMLFLAVTLGFLVENQREHYIEHLRARQYALSLIEDLKKDTAEFNILKETYIKNINKIDSFRTILKNQPLAEIPGGSLYYYCEPGLWSFAIIFHDATIQQLKNSGSLRYFSSELQYKVSEYDRKARELSARQENELYFSRTTREMMTGLFDSETILETRGADIENFKQREIKLIGKDTLLLRKIVNEIILRQASWKFRLAQIVEPTDSAAIDLLTSIEKEYHVK